MGQITHAMYALVPNGIFISILLFLCREMETGKAPKYMVDIERFEICPEYPDLQSPLDQMKFYKINRTTRAYSFETDLKRAIDESIGLKAELERWGSTGWTQIPFMGLQPDACNLFTKLLGELWVDIKRRMGVKEPEKCPIPPGHYSMQNYTYDTTSLGSFAPFKGKFRYKIMLVDMHTEKPTQCVVIVINVTDNI